MFLPWALERFIGGGLIQVVDLCSTLFFFTLWGLYWGQAPPRAWGHTTSDGLGLASTFLVPVCVCVGSKCVCANPSRDTVRLVLGRLTCRQTIRVKHTQTHICTHLSQPSCCAKPPHATTKMHNVKKGMWSISHSFWKIHLNWVLEHVLDHLRIVVGFYLINLKPELVLS